MLSKEELEQEYQRIAFWINNLDTKISYTLGATGVLLGFLLSNDDLAKNLKKHFKLLIQWDSSSIQSGILWFLFIVTICSLLIALWLFLSGLRAKIDPSKYNEPLIVTPSTIFFGDIAKGNYFTYQYKLRNNNMDDWLKDMQSQIFINSNICSQKSRLYNRGINLLKVGVISFVLYKFWTWVVL